jgi:prevent-host-death family protein
MKRVGVAELKNQLSAYLRAAEGGIEVEVTDRDRPIARIVAAAAPNHVVARPASKAFRALRRRAYPPAGWAQPSLQLLLEERRRR